MFSVKTNSGPRSLLEIVPKAGVKTMASHMESNSCYSRTTMAVGYPMLMKEGWLNPLITCDANIDVSMRIAPVQDATILAELKQELAKMEAKLIAASQKGVVDQLLQGKTENVRKVLADLEAGNEKMFKVALYVRARAGSLERLEHINKKVESALNEMMIIPKVPCMNMKEGLQSVMPVANDKPNITKTFAGSLLAAAFPFFQNSTEINADGRTESIVKKRAEKMLEAIKHKEMDEHNRQVFQLEKSCYDKSRLNSVQMAFLEENGYVEIVQPTLKHGGNRPFLVKVSNKNESAEHFFLVQLVAEEIRKYTQKVELYSTVRPDIIFEVPTKNGNQGKVAVEIETGSTLNDKKKLKEKVRLLKAEFGSNWFFVLTDYALKKKYSEYGPTFKRTEVSGVIKQFFKSEE